MKFRYKALQAKRNPDHLDSPLVLTDPRGWVALFVVLIVAAMLGLWAFLAQIPQTVEGRGTLGYPGSVQTVQAAVSGPVTNVSVAPGDQIRAGQSVATIKGQGGEQVVRAAQSGRVTALSVQPGAVLAVGDPVLSFEPGYSASARLQIVTALPVQTASDIRPGQSVKITVPGVNARRYGLLSGHVHTISEYVQTPASGGGADSATRAAVITLDGTGRDYTWTGVNAPDSALIPGMPVTISIQTAMETPIQVVLGGE